MKERLAEWDPFGLGARPKYKRFVMILLYTGIVALALTLILYLVLMIFSDRNAKLSKYSQQVREWKKRGEDQRISDISIALKIMPSENTKGNMIVMEYLTESILRERKLARVYNYSQTFFFQNQTSLYFPVFRFVAADIPVGDSEVYCVHLFWTQKENEQTLELYDSLKGFPKCRKAFNKRVIWHQHDPTHGAEVFTWKQNVVALTGCNDRDSCQRKCDKYKGIARRGHDKGYLCYAYEVLTDICLLIDYEAPDSWNYRGGCFEGGSPSRMISAEPGKTYDFENVKVHVRSVHDPFVVAAKENVGDDFFGFGLDLDFMHTIAFIILCVAILCGVLVAAGVILRKYIEGTKFYNYFFLSNNVLVGKDDANLNPVEAKGTVNQISPENDPEFRLIADA